jgi:hypothetical protein
LGTTSLHWLFFTVTRFTGEAPQEQSDSPKSHIQKAPEPKPREGNASNLVVVFSKNVNISKIPGGIMAHAFLL